jgi:hypothetical protein
MNQSVPAKHFARVNTRVTRAFKMRLQWACEKRERETARRVPEGEILSEMSVHLEPHPEETNGAAPARKKDPRSAEGKKRSTKGTVA